MSCLRSWKRSSWSLSLVKSKLESRSLHKAGGERRKLHIQMQRKMPSWVVVVMPHVDSREVSSSAALRSSQYMSLDPSTQFEEKLSQGMAVPTSPMCRLLTPGPPSVRGAGGVSPKQLPVASDKAEMGCWGTVDFVLFQAPWSHSQPCP